MSNMSYVRFENTLEDLRACDYALFDPGFESLSSQEKAYAKKLVLLCKEIADAYHSQVVK